MAAAERKKETLDLILSRPVSNKAKRRAGVRCLRRTLREQIGTGAKQKRCATAFILTLFGLIKVLSRDKKNAPVHEGLK
jgi:hypothetical protein